MSVRSNTHTQIELHTQLHSHALLTHTSTAPESERERDQCGLCGLSPFNKLSHTHTRIHRATGSPQLASTAVGAPTWNQLNALTLVKHIVQLVCFLPKGTQKATSKRRSFLIHSTPSECDKSTLTQSLWGGTHTDTHKEKTFPCEASDFFGRKNTNFQLKTQDGKTHSNKVNAGKGVWKTLRKGQGKETQRERQGERETHSTGNTRKPFNIVIIITIVVIIIIIICSQPDQTRAEQA